MKKWFYGLNITIAAIAAAGFIFSAPAFAAEDQSKVEKVGKKPTAAETKGMNKTDKTPKTKTAGNGADKTKTAGNGDKMKKKVDAKSQADEKALKKGGKTDVAK